MPTRHRERTGEWGMSWSWKVEAAFERAEMVRRQNHARGHKSRTGEWEISVITEEIFAKAERAYDQEAPGLECLPTALRAALNAVLPDILEAAAKVAEEQCKYCWDGSRTPSAIRALSEDPGTVQEQSE